MLMKTLPLRLVAASGVLAAATGNVMAGTGQPTPWQMTLQTPVTAIADRMHSFHDMLLWIITAIVVLVLGLILWVVYRFSEKRNPNPSKTTHNSLLEVAWTLIPVLILVVIAVPSFRLLKDQLTLPKADIVIKATAHQWYWSYEYPKDQGGFSFDSNMAQNKEPRLLAVDNEVVLPVDTTVRVQVTASDVIHAFAMPSFGLKIDAIPGRLNETWFHADKEGIFYGQCSLICGQNHAYMPIAIRIVSKEAYKDWLEQAKKKFAATGADRKYAANDNGQQATAAAIR